MYVSSITRKITTEEDKVRIPTHHKADGDSDQNGSKTTRNYAVYFRYTPREIKADRVIEEIQFSVYEYTLT